MYSCRKLDSLLQNRFLQSFLHSSKQVCKSNRGAEVSPLLSSQTMFSTFFLFKQKTLSLSNSNSETWLTSRNKEFKQAWTNIGAMMEFGAWINNYNKPLRIQKKITLWILCAPTSDLNFSVHK